MSTDVNGCQRMSTGQRRAVITHSSGASLLAQLNKSTLCLYKIADIISKTYYNYKMEERDKSTSIHDKIYKSSPTRTIKRSKKGVV